MGALHDLKQQDYGTDEDPFANVRATGEWGVPAWVGAMIRANDKLQRMKSMVRNGAVANEAIEDSFRDLAVYSIIGLILFEEEHGTKPPEPEIRPLQIIPGDFVRVNENSPGIDQRYWGMMLKVAAVSGIEFLWPIGCMKPGGEPGLLYFGRHEVELL